MKLKKQYISLNTEERLSLKDLRIKAGLSISAVEELIHVTKTRVQKAESGKKVEKGVVEKLKKKI